MTHADEDEVGVTRGGLRTCGGEWRIPADDVAEPNDEEAQRP
jgi:hypothetical protein